MRPREVALVIRVVLLRLGENEQKKNPFNSKGT